MTQPKNKRETAPVQQSKPLAKIQLELQEGRLTWDQAYTMTKLVVLLTDAGPESDFAQILVDVLKGE